ncbi:hypothetical protein WICPIJ_008232 [Wickerhamomyces pijperi]|uniref:Uncharacterized protein n=1 Tax=Wickerhamomyces pijperi TaxID=599730 RepID=A0A9P8TJF2_WICPI|nr:hypothetical protein WICPIJ_008232 [Wickerhamomyces pijperi]
MASISSMKIIQGSCSLAYANISLINLADSPMYLSTMADAGEKMKLAPMVAAVALAKRVLPVPGGPYKRTPFGGLIPTLWNNSGFFKGNSMTSLSSRTCSFNPPIVLKFTSSCLKVVML